MFQFLHIVGRFAVIGHLFQSEGSEIPDLKLFKSFHAHLGGVTSHRSRKFSLSSENSTSQNIFY
jgi:hypothetical protein